MAEKDENFRVVVQPYAMHKLEGHLAFLARVSGAAAERLRMTFLETFASLGENPKGCKRYESLIRTNLELYEKLCGRRYRLVFVVRGRNVAVIDIQDCRQDTDKNIV